MRLAAIVLVAACLLLPRRAAAECEIPQPDGPFGLAPTLLSHLSEDGFNLLADGQPAPPGAVEVLLTPSAVLGAGPERLGLTAVIDYSPAARELACNAMFSVSVPATYRSDRSDVSLASGSSTAGRR